MTNNGLWQVTQPISELPDLVGRDFSEHADFLISDLYSHRLTIKLVPAPDPHHRNHKIRVNTSKNPAWYSSLYNSVPNGVSRNNCVCALERIASFDDRQEQKLAYRYDTRMRSEIKQQLMQGFLFGTHRIPANNRVREYFKRPLDPQGYVPMYTEFSESSSPLESAPF